MENNNSSNDNNSNSYLIKSIYGVIGGIQSMLHMISGFFDIFYLLREFKTYILETLFKGIKNTIIFLKYLLTFQFIQTKNIKVIMNIISSLGISLCLIILIILKKEKENALKIQNNTHKSEIYASLNPIE